MIVSFTIPGKPVPKARPRFDRTSGRVYTPAKSVAYEKRVAAEAYSASRWHRDPESRTMSRRDDWPARTSCGRERPTRRAGKNSKCRCPWCASAVEIDIQIYLPDKRTRDLDNIEKSLLDGMNGVLFRDDRQVRAVSKRGQLDRQNPRVELIVKLFPPAQTGLGLPEPLLEHIQCSECEGTGGFVVTLPVSGKVREVVCGECRGTGKAIPDPRGVDL